MRGETRAFSLLEVMVATLILALVIWSLQVLYVGLLRGSLKAERHQGAVAALETLTQHFKDHARLHWTSQSVIIEDGEFQGYLYRVEESAPLVNPLDPDGGLKMRLVHVTLTFDDKDPATGADVKREKTAVISASR